MKLRILAVLIVLAVALRVIFWLEVMGFHAPLRGDEVDYHRLAVSLESGKGFVTDRGEPTATRPPLYPLLLAGIYRIFGASVEAGRALQVFLGAMIVLLLYALTRRLFAQSVALVAVAIAAFNPSLIFISSYLLVENLYIVLLLAALIFFSGALERALPFGKCITGGVLLGAASLTRPNAFPFALFTVAACFLLGRGSVRARGARSAVVLAAVAATIFPWAARNEARFARVVPFTTHGGLTFYQGNNRVVFDEPNYHGGVAPLEALPGLERLKGMNGEIERDAEAWRLGRSFIRENPKLIPAMAARRFMRFWRFRADVGMSGVKSGWWWDKGKSLGALASSIDVVFIFSVVSIPLFLFGLIATFRRYRSLFLLYGVIIVHTVTALVFFGSLRLRIPVEPVIAVFAAFGAAYIFEECRRLLGTRA